MAVRVYMKGKAQEVFVREGKRAVWQARRANVLVYGKRKALEQMWLCVFDAQRGGNLVAEFKGEEVLGFRLQEV